MAQNIGSYERTATLLYLENLMRHASSIDELAFIMVNNTRKLFYYSKAVLFECTSSSFRVTAVSGVDRFDINSPFAQWASKVADYVSRKRGSNNLVTIDRSIIPLEYKKQWDEFETENVMLCFLVPHDENVIAALWLSRNHTWPEAELLLLSHLTDGYAHALVSLRRKRAFFNIRPNRTAILIGLFIVLVSLIPVRHSALAVAEIAPRNPYVVSAPIDGVIADVPVLPNTEVSSGQVLFTLDDVALRGKVELARNALAVAEAEYRKSTQGAFNDSKSNAQVAFAKAQFELRRAELEYAKEMLLKSIVIATSPGILIFSDPNDWLGKPVRAGERIMQIARAKDIEVKIELNVSDSSVITSSSDVILFLDSDPLNPLYATVDTISYEPELNIVGNIYFRVIARLYPSINTPRLGLRGTARISGDYVPLAYHVLRRPLSYMRQQWLW